MSRVPRLVVGTGDHPQRYVLDCFNFCPVRVAYQRSPSRGRISISRMFILKIVNLLSAGIGLFRFITG